MRLFPAAMVFDVHAFDDKNYCFRYVRCQISHAFEAAGHEKGVYGAFHGFGFLVHLLHEHFHGVHIQVVRLWGPCRQTRWASSGSASLNAWIAVRYISWQWVARSSRSLLNGSGGRRDNSSPLFRDVDRLVANPFDIHDHPHVADDGAQIARHWLGKGQNAQAFPNRCRIPAD